jgi:hypothetical protein
MKYTAISVLHRHVTEPVDGAFGPVRTLSRCGGKRDHAPWDDLLQRPGRQFEFFLSEFEFGEYYVEWLLHARKEPDWFVRIDWPSWAFQATNMESSARVDAQP